MNFIEMQEVIKQEATDYPLDSESEVGYEERQQIVNSAKIGVRNRRGRRMQVILWFTSVYSVSLLSIPTCLVP